MTALAAVQCTSCFKNTVNSDSDSDSDSCSICGAKQAEPNRDRRALPIGTVVNGKYQIGRVLGSGGFGITYLAMDGQLDRRVALKEFFPSGLVVRGFDRVAVSSNSTEDELSFHRGLSRFFREGQILAKFDHPNIVRVIEVFEANGTAYLVMEFLDGMTLKSWLSQVGQFETSKALEVMAFMVDALRAAHAVDVVHRDLKPDNVYITRQGRTLLIDFGGAKELTSDGDKSMDAMFAHGYAAPEQYSADSDKIGPWTDVYACGATLFKILTGETVRSALDRFSEDPPLNWSQTSVPKSVRFAVSKALKLNRSERFQTIQEFQAALVDERVDTPSRWHLWAGVCFVLASLIAGAFWYYSTQLTNPITTPVLSKDLPNPALTQIENPPKEKPAQLPPEVVHEAPSTTATAPSPPKPRVDIIPPPSKKVHTADPMPDRY